MANYFDFSSDQINIFILVVDSSDSMSGDASNVEKGLKLYKKSFENFPEAGSIAVSVCKFNSNFYLGEFQPVTDFDTSYYTGGQTALYYSIVKSAEALQEYVEEITRRKNCVPRVTYILFSDGEPCGDRMNRRDAQEKISEMNYAGYTTVYVAFGDGITSEFGKKLGFMSTINVKDRDTLVQFLGVELSKSCKEQSRSMKSLGANFFSQAAGKSNSTGYSQTTAQALEDEDWMKDI